MKRIIISSITLITVLICNISVVNAISLPSANLPPPTQSYEIGGKTVYDIGQVLLKNVSQVNGQEILYYYVGGSQDLNSNAIAANYLCTDVQYYTESLNTNNYTNLHKPTDYMSTLPLLTQFIPYTQFPSNSSCINTITFDSGWRDFVSTTNKEYHIRLISSSKVISGNKNQIIIEVMEGKNTIPNRNVKVNIQDIEHQYIGGSSFNSSYKKELRTNNKGIIKFIYSGIGANMSSPTLTISIENRLGSFSSSRLTSVVLNESNTGLPPGTSIDFLLFFIIFGYFVEFILPFIVVISIIFLVVHIRRKRMKGSINNDPPFN